MSAGMRNTGFQPVRFAGILPARPCFAGWKPAVRTGWKPVFRMPAEFRMDDGAEVE
jgi:hypothetical protein